MRLLHAVRTQNTDTHTASLLFAATQNCWQVELAAYIAFFNPLILEVRRICLTHSLGSKKIEC